MIVGHKEAFDYVSELVKENEPLTESIIKQIHYLVLADKKDDRGVYRRIPVRIMGAHHEPVQPYLIKPKMEQLLQEYSASGDHIVTRYSSEQPVQVLFICGLHRLFVNSFI